MYNSFKKKMSSDDLQEESETELDKEIQNISQRCMNIKEYLISFLPPKIISSKLFWKYFLFFRRIIVENDPFIQSDNLDQNLKDYFNIQDFTYNSTNINILKDKLKEDLKKEHNIIETQSDENRETNISNKMILDFWYFVILEQILFQILIPSMNSIEDLMTFNYYMYENQDKLRKLKFVKFILKNFFETQNKAQENQYKLKRTIIEDEIHPLFSKINDDNFSKENANCTSYMSLLVSLYKDIIKGKQNWYTNIQRKEETEFLIKYENLKEEEIILLNLICFVFLANRLVTSPLNPRKGKVNFAYEFDISRACLKGIRLQQAITLIQFEKQINIVVLKDNIFEYLGMYELAIVCFLNNNVHHVDLTKCMIKPSNLEGFVKGLQHIQAFQDEKYFVKIAKLNLSNNECGGKELSQVLQLIPQINFLSLNYNTDGKIQKNYFAHLFNALEKLYRSKKSNLTHLFLKKCSLSESSLYQLTKLLRSYNCKLKLLAINDMNLDVPMGIKLLKDLKYNRSLEELYLNKTELKDTHKAYLLNIIPNTFIKTLYLHKNLLSIDSCFRIIAETQILDSNITREDLNINSRINNIDLSEQKKERYSKEEKIENNANKYDYARAHIPIILKMLKTSGLCLLDITGNIFLIRNQDLQEELPELLKKGLVTFC